jgi:hypothetical protein
MWNQRSFGCQDESFEDHFGARTTDKLFVLPLKLKASTE